MSPEAAPRIELGLNAAVVAAPAETPLILATDGPEGVALPYGPFDPLKHRTMELGLRGFVAGQTGLELGYVEQLYTFGDRGRHASAHDRGPHVMSVGYLALTRVEDQADRRFRPWYGFFPWEDMRGGRPAALDEGLAPRLLAWAAEPPSRPSAAALARPERVRLLFALDGRAWDEERVLERYECLYEAGLVAEARRDGRTDLAPAPGSGLAMAHDHRRILATAMGRLRAKLKYRPVIFELMPETFTLTELQRTVEAIAGTRLHKQNFRRLVEGAGLVEPTGATRAQTGGRPAALHRFRREVVGERPAPGLKVTAQRG